MEDTSVEDNLSGRRPPWKIASVVNDLSGRRSQWKTTSVEDDLSGKVPLGPGGTTGLAELLNASSLRVYFI